MFARLLSLKLYNKVFFRNNMNQASRWTTNDVFWPVKEFWIGLHTVNNNLCWEDNTCNSYNNLYFANVINSDNNCYFATNNTTNNFTWSNPKGGTSPNKCCQDKYKLVDVCIVSVPIVGCLVSKPTYPIDCSADTKQSIICQNSDLRKNFYYHICPPLLHNIIHFFFNFSTVVLPTKLLFVQL